MRQLFVVYGLVLLIFGAGIYLALERGKQLEAARSVAVARPTSSAMPPGTVSLAVRHPPRLALLLLQLIVIVSTARLFGVLFLRFRQPAVIGEIVAGIVLGPSVLGALAPRAFSFLFEPSSLGTLELLAQIGILLFLFVIGLELDTGRVRQRAQTAVVVSHASIVIPYFLGVVLSLLLYRDLAPAGVSFLAFALFLGIAMSITAFPVLARILADRSLTSTDLGSTAMTCAAVDDVTAWSLLAIVIAVVSSRGLFASAVTVVLTLLFLVAMIWVVRPWLARLFTLWRWNEAPSRTAMAGVLILLLLSALATEAIGIHALFGAFLAGVVVPRAAELKQALTERLEEVSTVLFVPVFFAFTGLRTEIGLLSGARDWLLCLLIVLLATAGKLGGSMLAARLTNLGWIDSFALGALLNTRGLMELIALNVGYELGILSPRIFAMLVLMALATTLATGPLLSAADAWRRRAALRSTAALVPEAADTSIGRPMD